jgi:hypothetical protein
LKSKNSEGFGRISQIILVEGVDFLIGSVFELFKRKYEQKMIPHQWLVAQTIPVFKNKGNINDIDFFDQ